MGEGRAPRATARTSHVGLQARAGAFGVRFDGFAAGAFVALERFARDAFHRRRDLSSPCLAKVPHRRNRLLNRLVLLVQCCVPHRRTVSSGPTSSRAFPWSSDSPAARARTRHAGAVRPGFVLRFLRRGSEWQDFRERSRSPEHRCNETGGGQFRHRSRGRPDGPLPGKGRRRFAPGRWRARREGGRCRRTALTIG